MKKILFILCFLPFWGLAQNKQFVFREGGASGVVSESQLVPSWTNVSGRPTALSQFTNDLNLDATYGRLGSINTWSNFNYFTGVPVLKDPVNLKSVNAFNKYLSFQDIANSEAGWFGYGSASNNDLSFYNSVGILRFYGNGAESFRFSNTSNTSLLPLSMSGQKITDVGNPTLTTDAINLGYANTNYLGISAKAANSTLLQGKDTGQIAQRNTINTFTESNIFNKRIAIGGALSTSYMLNVTGNANISTSLDVGTSVTSPLLNLTDLASSTTNTEVLSISSNVVKSQNVKDLEIGAYQPITLSVLTSDVGGGVLKHILTLDCGNYYQKTFKVNMTNNSATAGTQVTFTNMKAGGMYTVIYYNNSVRDILYDSSAKIEDGSTNFSVISQSGAFTHHFRGISTSAVMKAF